MNTELSGILVTIAFVTSFTGIAIWAYWPSNKARLQAKAHIPLDDSPPEAAPGAPYRPKETHHV